MTEPSTHARSRARTAAYRAAGAGSIILLLPIAIILVAGLSGMRIGEIPDFPSLVMGVLTLLAGVALFFSIASCVRTGRIDWLALFITGSSFIFWGSVFQASIRS